MSSGRQFQGLGAPTVNAFCPLCTERYASKRTIIKLSYMFLTQINFRSINIWPTTPLFAVCVFAKKETLNRFTDIHTFLWAVLISRGLIKAKYIQNKEVQTRYLNYKCCETKAWRRIETLSECFSIWIFRFPRFPSVQSEFVFEHLVAFRWTAASGHFISQ